MNSTAFSPTRLQGMHRVLASHVDQGRMPGLVALISRHDEVQHFELGHPALLYYHRDVFRVTGAVAWGRN